MSWRLEGSKLMDAASPVVVASQPSSNRRLNLLQLLGFAAGAALLIVGGLYTVRYLGATSFDQQRAFRALDETAGQLDNLQGALAGLLRLMRDDLTRCVADPPLPVKVSRQCEAYKRRIALEGVEAGVITVDRPVPRQACVEGVDVLIVLRTGQPGIPSTAMRCKDVLALPSAAATESHEPVKLFGLKGLLTDIVGGFITQNLFDEVLIALPDGTVIASVPASDAFATDMRKPLHPARITRLSIPNASALLRPEPPAASEKSEKDKDKVVAPPPPAAQPVVFSHTIGGDRYQVFVRLMRPKVPIYVEAEGSTPEVQQQNVVYLVGLKRADLRSDVAKAISPGSRFWLTLLFLLALFVWPLANVKSKSAAETISWGDLVACLFSLVFIPATLAIGAVWCWGYLALERWADSGAASYAQSIKESLRAELAGDLQLLSVYRDLRGSGTESCGWKLPAQPARLPIREHVYASQLNEEEESPETCTLRLADGTATWSPLSSAFATDVNGMRSGGLTAFRASIVRKDAPYASRQYFRSLRDDEAWLAPAINPTEQFVAQRVFSFSDGARILQLAIRRHCAADNGEAFCGIVSGGSRVYGLSAAVLPPLLKFAVVDRYTGSVLFHPDDRRSLAENLFVETEQNASLRAAATANRGAYFDGRYLGEGHRFAYVPMDDLPWGIVVMYSQRDLGELSWHAGLTALAAYAGLILIVATILTLGLLWRARCRPNAKNMAYVLWPHEPHEPHQAKAAASGGLLAKLRQLWHGACFYECCGVITFFIVVVAVVGYESIELHKISALTWVMAALWVLAIALFAWRRRQFRRREVKISAVGAGVVARRRHGMCLAIALTLVSALPAAWMALGYQDAQVQGLVRDGLLSASRDVVRRHDTIARDLRRLGANINGAGLDAWERTVPSATTSIPGFAAGSCDKSATSPNVWALCVFEPPPLSHAIATLTLDFWRRETWRAAAPTEKQLRRIALLTKPDPDISTANLETNANQHPSCYGYEDSPLKPSPSSWTGCRFQVEDGRPFTLAAGSWPSTAGASKTIESDAASFTFATRVIFNFLPTLIVLMLIGTLASFVNRRLFGCEVQRKGRAGHDPADDRLIYSSFEDAPGLARYLKEKASERINLAYSRLFVRAHSFKPRLPAYLLDDLDLALADADRRALILEWLEEIAERKAELVFTTRRPPLDQLIVHGASPDEIMRWHALLRPLFRDMRQVSADTQGKPATLCARERWQVCTREERLLLHQMASGVLVNPLNRTVLENLARRGEIKFDPWPMISSPDFRAFVKRVGAEPEMTQLLHQSAGSSKSTRRTLLGLLLAIVLLLVVWFSWAAGDQFKIVYAVLAGALAFLGQISQAFSFVRGAGQSGK